MRHWLLVTRPWNWRVCEEKGLFGLDERYGTTVARFVRTGDLAVVYVTQAGIVGVVEITEMLPNQVDHVGWRKGKKESEASLELYPHRFRWKWATKFEVPKKLDPRSNRLLDELEYFTDKSSSWYSFVYPSIARVPEADIATIARWNQDT